MKTRNRFGKSARLLAVVLILALVGGCGPTTPVSTPPASPAGADSSVATSNTDLSGELEIWSWSESEIETLSENFNKVYPNVTLKYVPVENGDVTLKLQVAAASDGNLPDLAYMEVMTRGKLFAMDIWEDLSAEPYNMNPDDVFAPLLNYMQTEDGRILGVDREFNPSGFVFRRSLAKEYLGTDNPDEMVALLSDWDKFVEAGKIVREKSGGKVYMLPGLDDINWMLNGQYSDPVFVDNTAQLTKFFTHMFTPMVKIRDAGIAGVMKRWTPAWNASYNDANVLIYQYAPWSGNAALKTNAPDAVGDWSVIKATGGAFTLGGTAYGIPKKAKNKELAWEFIRWTLLTQEGTAACVDSLGVVASYAPFYKTPPQSPDPYFNNQDVNQYLLEQVAPEMKLRRVHEFDGVLNEVSSLLMDMIVDDATMTVEQAVATAIAECKNKLPADMTIV